ncbi:sensor histidine kinase [Pedobacter sp. KR3-3]|uniref:histidine kinase n=1 Tax=Pedobacter albus TaxID=3113905 RepID=A0ABU7I458_9SPHI|nr:sensor histidine kinase [Pedobacter sp. KR3-3]MEE1944235.1 sensor histidine kinase [Pedobacter sp. KR3-3]
MLLILALCCIKGLAQNKVISRKDSLAFAELVTQYNNIVNQNAAKADSIAVVYFSKAQQMENDDYMGRGATLITTTRMALKKTAQATEWYNKAQQYFVKAENYLWKGYANLNMGILYSQQYDFEKGFGYLIKSVQDFEKAGDSSMVVSAYVNISNTFHDSKNYAKGIAYAKLALKKVAAHPGIKDYYHWAAFNALAINYDDNKDYAQAIKAHLQALPYADKSIHSTYNNLGNSYKKMGRLDSAIYYLHQSLESLENNPPGWAMDYNYATVYGNLADVNRIQKKYLVANVFLDSALYHSQKSESPEKLLDAYEYAYQLKKDMQQYKPAMGYLEKFVALKDSLLNKEKTTAILNLQEKYEAEKKQKIIEQQKFEIAQKNQWLWLVGMGLILVCIAAYLLYKINKNKQEKKLQQEIFNRQAAEAKALFDGEQNERIRIARDLHDGVGQMLSLVKMSLSTLDASDVAVEKAILFTDKTIAEVRDVSHNLIPQELNFGLFRALENLSEKVNESGQTKMSIDIPEHIQKIQFEKQNELSIYRIVQEVVNNMIKHAGASEIGLSIQAKENQILIALKDNGHGLDVGDIDQSKGMGWKNINARVNMLDGKISVQSEKLSGTQIEITLPANEAI